MKRKDNKCAQAKHKMEICKIIKKDTNGWKERKRKRKKKEETRDP